MQRMTENIINLTKLKQKILETIRHYEEQIIEVEYYIESMLEDVERKKGEIEGYKNVIEDLKIDIGENEEWKQNNLMK